MEGDIWMEGGIGIKLLWFEFVVFRIVSNKFFWLRYLVCFICCDKFGKLKNF